MLNSHCMLGPRWGICFSFSSFMSEINTACSKPLCRITTICHRTTRIRVVLLLLSLITILTLTVTRPRCIVWNRSVWLQITAQDGGILFISLLILMTYYCWSLNLKTLFNLWLLAGGCWLRVLYDSWWLNTWIALLVRAHSLRLIILVIILFLLLVATVPRIVLCSQTWGDRFAVILFTSVRAIGCWPFLVMGFRRVLLSICSVLLIGVLVNSHLILSLAKYGQRIILKELLYWDSLVNFYSWESHEWVFISF